MPGSCQRALDNAMKNIIKNLPEDQRPYEKCFYQGEDTLSDSELLAVILRSGTREQNSLSLAQTVLQYMEIGRASCRERVYVLV